MPTCTPSLKCVCVCVCVCLSVCLSVCVCVCVCVCGDRSEILAAVWMDADSTAAHRATISQSGGQDTVSAVTVPKTQPASGSKKRRSAPVSAPVAEKRAKPSVGKAGKSAAAKQIAPGTNLQTKCGAGKAPLDVAAFHSADVPAGPAGEKEPTKGHDKYCHFCQHVKINMLACTATGCTHRYCIYCLGVHLGDGTEPSTSQAWSEGKWTCPTCRAVCCCSATECTRNHRHCKAYRYRLRRADAANMRATAANALVSLMSLVSDQSAFNAERAGSGEVGEGKADAAINDSHAKIPLIKSELGADAPADDETLQQRGRVFTDIGDVVPLTATITAQTQNKADGVLPSPLKFDTRQSDGVSSCHASAMGTHQASELPLSPSRGAVDALALLSQAASRKEDEDGRRSVADGMSRSSPSQNPPLHGMCAVANLLNSPAHKQATLPPECVDTAQTGRQGMLLAALMPSTGSSGSIVQACGTLPRDQGSKDGSEDDTPGLVTSRSSRCSDTATRSGSEDGASPMRATPPEDGAGCAHPALIMAVRRLSGGLLMSEGPESEGEGEVHGANMARVESGPGEVAHVRIVA